MSKHRRVEYGTLALVVLIYVLLGGLYAALTPDWQIPDEPAHYNYVSYLVRERRLPVLSIGDYDQAYLSEITSRRFDPVLSIEPIRYEFHQPPLYYALAAPLYVVFRGALLPLRLFSVALGAALLVVAYRAGKILFPHQAWPALGLVAFMAFIPQHITMTAGVENDVLAELILAIVLMRLVRWLEAEEPASYRQLAVTGVWIGLGLLTKMSVYIAVPLAGIAWWLRFRPWGHRDGRARAALTSLVALLLPALALGLPWFVRNAVVYGGLDVAGLGQHGRVVMGQMRTTEWIAENGWQKLPGAFLRTTFHSFWAQFGWMAVPIDGRIYTALGVLCGLVLLGVFLRLVDVWEQRRQWRKSVLLLACSALMTLATYLWYNLSFYQAQGRYLFSALVPLGLAWSIGLREILRRDNALWIGLIMALVTVVGGVRWLMKTCADTWRVLASGVGTGFLGARLILPEWALDGLFALPFLLLAFLSAISPFRFIVPYLSP